MSYIEKLVNNYVSCWMPIRPTYSDVWEDNDFGCEHFQIFRNGFNLEDLEIYSHWRNGKLEKVLCSFKLL